MIKQKKDIYLVQVRNFNESFDTVAVISTKEEAMSEAAKYDMYFARISKLKNKLTTIYENWK